MGYGLIGSFLTLGYRMYAEKSRTTLKLTRDRRLFPDEFPLATVQSVTAVRLHAVDTMERNNKTGEKDGNDGDYTVQDGLRFNGKLGEKCKTCDKWIVASNTNPRCGRCVSPNSKAKHQYGDRCRTGWCKGHAGIQEEPTGSPQVVQVGEDSVFPHLDPATSNEDDNEAFHDAEKGEPLAPPALAPPADSGSPSSTSGMSGPLQRPLHRTAKVMGTSAAVGAAHAAGLGPVGATIAGAISGAIGESVAGAVSGLINPSRPSASSSSSGNVAPGTGFTHGESVVYPQQALHQASGASESQQGNIPEEETSGGSSSSIPRAGASGMLARTLKKVTADALMPTMCVPPPKSGRGPFAKGYAIVTMDLKRGDPILRTAQAGAATQKEVDMLLKSGAFLFEEVYTLTDSSHP